MLAMTDSRDSDQAAVDKAMMERCIRLSAEAIKRGEFPFAAIVALGPEVVVETTNEVARGGDVTRHAELLAVSEAQRKLERRDLSGCTLYTTVEPCPMCSFPMRETRISRVVFAISSPMMGGLSKWNVLRDGELSRVMPEAFGPVPEVIAGLSRREAEKVWRSWNPLIWSVIAYRGCLGGDPPVDAGAAEAPYERYEAIPDRSGWLRRLLSFGRLHR